MSCHEISGGGGVTRKGGGRETTLGVANTIRIVVTMYAL